MTPQPSLSMMRAHRATRLGASAVFALVALIVIAYAPNTLAQTGNADNGSDSAAATPKKPKKKNAKPAPTDPPAGEASAANQPEAPPPAAPSAEANEVPPPAVPNVPPNDRAWDITDTFEDPSRTYLFVGLRYRGTVIPQFFENIFIDNGATFYSNSFAIELDIRKGRNSIIPWIEYADYATGNTLFHQKGQDPTNASFYSVVKSSLKAVYIGVDERWAVNIVRDKFDYEAGFGVGLGAIFGNLYNNWVTSSATPTAFSANGMYFAPCYANVPQSMNNNAPGCRTMDHQNATVAKVNGYVEKNWFNGGSVPTVLPHISIVPLSFRYKPLKALAMRFDAGIQLTGFFFDLAVDYGLEQKPRPDDHTASRETRLRDTL